MIQKYCRYAHLSGSPEASDKKQSSLWCAALLNDLYQKMQLKQAIVLIPSYEEPYPKNLIYNLILNLWKSENSKQYEKLRFFMFEKKLGKKID